MLKSLKRKFVITNMILVGIVLSIVFMAICTNIYTSQMSEIDRTLNAPFSTKTNTEGELGYMTSVVVLTDSEGNISDVYVRGASLSDKKLERAVNQVINSDESDGRISGLNLFFQKNELGDGSDLIVFVDASRLDETMLQTVFMLLVIYVLTMIVIFIVSEFMASIAIKPVQKSWTRQKQFVADASHELKTPLTVIMANNDILKSKKDSTIGEEYQWIDSTIEETKHMKKLIDDMLFLAKSDNPDAKNHTMEINISDLAEGDVLQFEPVAFEAGVNLQSNIQPEVYINGDGTQLKQLLHILIDNAIKYATSKEGMPKVEIDISANSKKEIIVKNTCEMLSPKQLEHIFDRFYRGDDSRTRDDTQGGYGLGLAIAKTIVENHKGKITAVSGLNIGPGNEEGIEFKVIF